MKANKRLFTKAFHLNVADGALGGVNWTEALGIWDWLMEEDIIIVGVHMMIYDSTGGNQNDGCAIGTAELSQAGIRHTDGRIARVLCYDNWNTTPAFGHQTIGQLEIMFPEDARIRVKEEGHLYIHGHCIGKTAGNNTFSTSGTIFYHKA